MTDTDGEMAGRRCRDADAREARATTNGRDLTPDDALPAHPRVGGLYGVETIWLSGTDPKAKRPLVVLAMPG